MSQVWSDMIQVWLGAVHLTFKHEAILSHGDLLLKNEDTSTIDSVSMVPVRNVCETVPKVRHIL